MKKKLLTSLLIGSTLSSVANSAAFALDNSSNNNSVNGSSKNSSSEIPYTVQNMSRTREAYTISSRNSERYRLVHDGPYLYLYDNYNRRFVTGLFTIDGDTYYFDNRNEYAVSGWYNTGGYRYYFDPSTFKALKNGFHMINGTRYLFDSNGHIMTGLNRIHGRTYYTNGVGAVVTGWYNTNGNRYYFNPNDGGAAYTGWYQDLAYSLPWGQMYFHDDGRMAKGVTNINGNIYLFQPHGKGQNYYIATGFYTDTSNGNRYYFDANDRGRAHKGWLDLDDRFYSDDSMMYFHNDGTMARGVTRIGNDIYLFTEPRTSDPNYYRSYGWYTDGYFGRGPRYYFDKRDNGKALKGSGHVIDGKKYDFDNNGVLVKGPY